MGLCVQDIQQNPALLKGDGDKASAARVAMLEDAAKEDKKEQRRKKAAGLMGDISFVKTLTFVFFRLNDIDIFV